VLKRFAQPSSKLDALFQPQIITVCGKRRRAEPFAEAPVNSKIRIPFVVHPSVRAAVPEFSPGVLVTPLTVGIVAVSAPPTALPTPPSKPPPLPEPLETFPDDRGYFVAFIESPMRTSAAARVKELIPRTIFFIPLQKLLCRAIVLGRDF
jgi:hypothetical protein